MNCYLPIVVLTVTLGAGAPVAQQPEQTSLVPATRAACKAQNVPQLPFRVGRRSLRIRAGSHSASCQSRT
jgi:hypothetical protein